MQPTNDEPQRTERTGWVPSDTGGWTTPAAGSAAGGTTITKARPWLTALVSFVVLLILVAALGNQWVTDSVARHANAGTFGDHLAHSVDAYQWRFSSPSGGDTGHFWVANLANIGTVLILTLLLVAMVCRGKGSFWQSLFAAWFTVVVATLLGDYVHAALIDQSQLGNTGQGKAEQILFSSLSPGPSTAFAGLAFGLVVGLAAGITAVLSRRTEVIAAPVTPTFGAPWTRDDEPERPWQPVPPPPGPTVTPSPWSGSDTDRTPDAGSAAAPPPADTGEHTAVLPSVDQPTQAAPAFSDDTARTDTASDDTQATTQFGRDSVPPEETGQPPQHRPD